MDDDTFDNDGDTSDAEYFAFVQKLEETTASDLRAAKGDSVAQRGALHRYYQRGYRANLTRGELVDFLCVSSPSILEKAGYSDTEADAILAIHNSLTKEAH